MRVAWVLGATLLVACGDDDGETDAAADAAAETGQADVAVDEGAGEDAAPAEDAAPREVGTDLAPPDMAVDTDPPDTALDAAPMDAAPVDMTLDMAMDAAPADLGMDAEPVDMAADMAPSCPASAPVAATNLGDDAPQELVFVGVDFTADIVAIQNVSAETVTTNAPWRLCRDGRRYDTTLPTMVVAPGETVFLHMTQSDTDAHPNYFMANAAFDLASEGMLILYHAAGYSTPGSVETAVRWGTAVGFREATTDAAGIWADDEFVPVAAGHEAVILREGATSSTEDGDWVSIAERTLCFP